MATWQLASPASSQTVNCVGLDSRAAATGGLVFYTEELAIFANKITLQQHTMGKVGFLVIIEQIFIKERN